MMKRKLIVIALGAAVGGIVLSRRAKAARDLAMSTNGAQTAGPSNLEVVEVASETIDDSGNLVVDDLVVALDDDGTIVATDETITVVTPEGDAVTDEQISVVGADGDLHPVAETISITEDEAD
jgi:hypothetical protein